MRKQQIVKGDVWKNRDVVAAAKTAKSRVFCVAYVTQAQGSLFRPDDVLVCDASSKAVSCGETDPHFLRKLLNNGVRIYSCDALHAKCAVFDDFVLLGSANMSESSASRLVELSVLENDRRLSLDVNAFVLGLIRSDIALELSSEDLDRLSKKWRSKQVPWQCGFVKRKVHRSRGGCANHIVTVTNRLSRRSVTQEELDKSGESAERHVQSMGIPMRRGISLDYYYTTEEWGGRKPKEGDSLICVVYNNGRKGARANVFYPGTVVMVDRKRKAHIVHYLAPDKSIPYGIFRDKFNLKKSVNRFSISNQEFDAMAKFITSVKM